jgi:hypothetical protein
MLTYHCFLSDLLSCLYKCLYQWRWAFVLLNNPKVRFNHRINKPSVTHLVRTYMLQTLPYNRNADAARHKTDDRRLGCSFLYNVRTESKTLAMGNDLIETLFVLDARIRDKGFVSQRCPWDVGAYFEWMPFGKRYSSGQPTGKMRGKTCWLDYQGLEGDLE